METKAKIAFLVSDTNAGGMATSTGVIVENIDRSKYEVHVVTWGPGLVGIDIGKKADLFFNINVGSFPVVRKFVNGQVKEDFLGWFKLGIWIIKCIWHLYWWIKKEKIELIHTSGVHCNLIAGLVCKMSGVPSIWHIHNTQKHSWRRGGPFLVEGYLASLLATKFIAVSEAVRKTFHFSWQKKAVTILNAIEVDNIYNMQKHGELRKLAGVEDGEQIIGMIGRISYLKRMDVFLKVACKVISNKENVKVLIVGGAPNKISEECQEDLIELSNKLGISQKVCFMGDLKNASFYTGDMDVTFMCSEPGDEAFGLVVAEAMAAGVPTVAFANNAMPEIIEDGKTGFLIPEGALDMAAEKVLEILNNKELALHFKEAAKNRAKTYFDKSRLIKEVEQLYDGLLQGKRK